MGDQLRRTGRYDLRIVIQRRVLGERQGNGEYAETWPDPTPGDAEYFAQRDSLTSGEQIVQGIRNSTGGMRLRIKGRAIPVDANDRVKVKSTGEVYEVSGVHRDGIDTVISVERLRGQSPV